jgi:mannitol 2-dehydrogenase
MPVGFRLAKGPPNVTSLNTVALPTLDLAVPSYDRSAASVGIVHFGFGNFHRSHEAMYIDRLMQHGSGLEWGICGVGVMPRDGAMRDVMASQDCLFTLVERHADGSVEPRVIGSVIEYLFAPDDPEAVFGRLVDPAVRIVSLTVTEGGYLKNPATGEFDASDEAVVHDLRNPASPRTVFAYIVEGLRRRRAAGIPPFTVLSCDNLQGNGDVALQSVSEFARLVDEGLADWIRSEVPFPNCMVDRITPATTEDDRGVLAQEFGLDDRWPVPAEPFTQWIVEDRFPLGRPALETVGVQFVEDVRPYELMKLRLLNASHQALAYFGAPLGYVLVDETMRDDRIREYLQRYMSDEAAPTLGDLPGIDLDAYMATLIERFANPGVKDTLVRLATDGSNRMATFTLPAVRENLAAGRPVRLGAAMCAAWAEYWALIGRGQISGSEVPQDVHASALAAAALDDDQAAFIEQRTLWGDLADDTRFREAFLEARRSLEERGVHETLDALLGR